MPRLAIVVCVHDALEYAKICLDSVLCHTVGAYQLIVVDDGSAPATASWLAELAERYRHVEVITHANARGYTCAANAGLRRSKADYTVLLNSDTIVSPGWAERLIACAASSPRIGLVGPLSNAATYQSVPETIDAGGAWSQNELPADVSVSRYASWIAEVSAYTRPRVPVVNGFCFLVCKTVIDAIGYLDEEAFPRGYGEENDYCVRAAQAGFELAIADDAYVYHAVSKSFGPSDRDALVEQAHRVLRQKHSEEVFDEIDGRLRTHAGLEAVRRRLEQSPIPFASSRRTKAPDANNDVSILFLLSDCVPEAGGTQVIHETAAGLSALGADVRIAAHSQLAPAYRSFFDDGHDLFHYYDDDEALYDYARRFRIGVATIFHSVEVLAAIVHRNPRILPAYFVQDYEPWFIEPGSQSRRQAEQSYERIPGCVLFALSPWVCKVVREKHGVPVRKVWGSLDTSVFYPDYSRRLRIGRASGERVVVSAMVRPSTPWRRPAATLRLLAALEREFGDRVAIEVFGVGDAELAASGLPTDFEFRSHGRLGREGVAALLRNSDLFIDLSQFQAFGRTALEAMACGCAVIAPQRGGVQDFGTDGHDIVLVDTDDEEACTAAAARLVASPERRSSYGRRAAGKAAEYSVQRSARSVAEVLVESLAKQVPNA